MKWFLVLGAFLNAAVVSANEEYFVKVDAEINGKKVAFECVKKGNEASRELSDNFFPQHGNKKRSVQVACGKGGKYGGVSFAFLSSEDPLKIDIPPFDGSKTLENMDKWFTMRIADGDELQVHSFVSSEERGIRQHYKGAPVLKITEFVRTEEGGKVFHTYGGNVSAEFEEKLIQGKKKGAAGKGTISFRFRTKCTSDPGAKIPC